MTDISQAEFLVIIRWKVDDLATHVRGKGGRYVLEFRKKLQKALADYSKAVRYPQPLDKIQMKCLAMAQKLEKWARMAYIESEKPGMAAAHPFWHPKRIKKSVDNNWENFVKKESY